MNYQEYFSLCLFYFVPLGLCLKISTNLTKNRWLGLFGKLVEEKNEEWGMGNEEWGMRNEEWGMRNGE